MDLFAVCIRGRNKQLLLKLLDVLQAIKLCVYLLLSFCIGFGSLLIQLILLKIGEIIKFLVINNAHVLSLGVSLLDLVASNAWRVLGRHHLLLELLEIEVLEQEDFVYKLRFVLERHYTGSAVVNHQVLPIVDFLEEFALILFDLSKFLPLRHKRLGRITMLQTIAF